MGTNKALFCALCSTVILLVAGIASCRGCYALEQCGRDEPCKKIARVRKKCFVHSKGKSLELLEDECWTATRRGNRWVQWHLDCLEQWGMDCEPFRECVRLKEQREQEKWRL